MGNFSRVFQKCSFPELLTTILALVQQDIAITGHIVGCGGVKAVKNALRANLFFMKGVCRSSQQPQISMNGFGSQAIKTFIQGITTPEQLKKYQLNLDLTQFCVCAIVTAKSETNPIPIRSNADNTMIWERSPPSPGNDGLDCIVKVGHSKSVTQSGSLSDCTEYKLMIPKDCTPSLVYLTYIHAHDMDLYQKLYGDAKPEQLFYEMAMFCKTAGIPVFGGEIISTSSGSLTELGLKQALKEPGWNSARKLEAMLLRYGIYPWDKNVDEQRACIVKLCAAFEAAASSASASRPEFKVHKASQEFD